MFNPKPVFEMVERELGEGFIAADVFDKKSGMSIGGVKSNPRACALFNHLSDQLIASMARAGDMFGALDYYLIFEKDGGLVIVAELTEAFRLGMKMDSKRCSIGLLLSVVLPDAIAGFRQALSAK